MVSTLRLRQASEDQEQDEEVIYRWKAVDPPSETNTEYYDRLVYAYQNRSMRGFDVPQFHKRKRSGELLPFTPWDQYESEGETSGVWDRYTTDGSTIYHDWYVNPHGYIWQTGWRLTPEAVLAHAPSDVSEYVTRAAASIYAKGWDALTFLAELKDIHRLYSNLAEHLEVLLKKRRRPSGFGGFSSDWLSTRYGWRPLINDIKNIIGLVQRWGTEKQERHTGSSFGGYSFTDTNLELDLPGVNEVRYRKVVDTIEVNPRACVVADIVIPAIQINPIQTGWELIPFSFVVDWVLNVGKTIAALSVLVGATSYVACKGFKITVTREFEYGLQEPAGGWISGTCLQTGKSVASYTRRIPCGIPIIPRFDVRFDWRKMLDINAYISQHLK